MSRLFKSMTGVVVLAILVFSMLANAAPVFAADATMSVSPATITVTSGQSFNVMVSLNTAMNVNAVGFQMDWNGPEGTVHCNGISLACWRSGYLAASGPRLLSAIVA